MHAESISAANWWARPRGEGHAEWVETYRRSLGARHRSLIVEIVKSIPNVTSVLEVGSHCGPNLIRLAKDMRSLEQLTGIDVNADAIVAGNRWAQSLGLADRIAMVEGRVPDRTSSLPDGAVDVVISCYSLAYIAPADLDPVLWEIGRLAKRAVVLAEPMGQTSSGGVRAFSEYAEWTHNYAGELKWIGTLRDCAMKVYAVDPPVDRLNGVLVATRAET